MQSCSAKLLVPYAIVLGCIVCVQIGGIVAVASNYKALDTGGGMDNARNVMRDEMMRAWGHGNCTSAPPPYNTTNTYSVTCEQERWLEKFVNEVCDHSGTAVLEQMRNESTAALLRGEYHLLGYYGKRLARASATEASIRVCLADTNTTIASSDGGGAFCVCVNVLMNKIELLKKIAIVAVCLVVVQALLFVMALVIIGLDPARGVNAVVSMIPTSKKITV